MMSMRRAVSFAADPSLNRPPSPTEGTAFFRQHAQKGQRKDRSIDWVKWFYNFLFSILPFTRLLDAGAGTKNKESKTNINKQTRFDDVTQGLGSFDHESTGWRPRWGWTSRLRGRWWGRKTVRLSCCVLASGPRQLWIPWCRRPRGCRREVGAGWRWSCRARWFRGRPGTAGWRKHEIGTPWMNSG